MQKIENYSQMCDVVLNEVQKDAELLSLHKGRLDNTCYQDEALHLLTMDIVFYGSNYMSEDLFGTGDNYWPSLKDYRIFECRTSPNIRRRRLSYRLY